MPIHDFHQSFNSGELSPLLDSRVAIEKYASGCLTMENFIPLPTGPVMKRAGLVWQSASIGTGRIVGMQLGSTAYALVDLSSTKIRAMDASGAWSAEFTTTWNNSSLWTGLVKFAQVNRVAYAVHPLTPPARLTFSAASVLTAVDFDFQPDYPALLDENITDTTITPSATSGAGITLTASTSIFTDENVGSYYELAQVRASTFAEVVMGDASAKASKAITFSAAPADGDYVTIDGRVLTFRSAGRDEADEVGIGRTTDETADGFITAINNGGGGALPFSTVEAEEIGGLFASVYFGNGTGAGGTDLADNETITIGDVSYKFENSGDLGKPYEVLRGTSLFQTLTNLKNAINRGPAGETDNPNYFVKDAAGETLQHPKVEAVAVVADGTGWKIQLRARESGEGGNSITVSETSAASSFYAATALTGGSRVILIRAKNAGAAGNSIAINSKVSGGASNSTAVTWAGGATALSGGADETDSASLTVLGKYEIRTTGRWTGTLELRQLRDDLATYDTIHAWKSQADYNVNFQAEVLKHTTLQLRFTGSGEKLDNTWPRAILEPLDPYHRGIVKVTGYTSGTVLTATVIKTLLSTVATKFWSEGAWSPRRGYPGAACFHQNRLWFAGSTYEPNKLWASQLGDFENFRVTSSDDGGLVFAIASTDLQQVLWLVSHRELVIGTDCGEWTAGMADGSSAITPTNPPIFRQVSRYGSDEVIQAVVAGESVLYVQKGGRILRRMFYDGNGYVTGNLTALADHLTEGGVFESLAVQSSPEMIVWTTVLSSTPFLASLTYEQEQNVFAWARHPVQQGTIRYAAVTYGDSGSEVWGKGSTTAGVSAGFIGRLDLLTHNRTLTYATEANHMDCSSVYTAAAGSVTIPDALVGLACSIYYTASTTPALERTAVTVTPSSTTLTLPSGTHSIIVGLLVQSTMRTMRLEYPLRDGTAQGRSIKVHSVVVRFVKSQGGSARSGDGAYSDISYTTATTTYSGEANVSLASSHLNDGTVTVYHTGPLPFTMTGLIIRADVGGSAATHYTVAEL